jgi:23S rRNA (guanine1835-N2)-methyltransferase
VLSSYRLERIPQEPGLQAWNAADELLLKRDIELCTGQILLLNDSFGALAVTLADKELCWWNDSAMAHDALKLNCATNQVRLPIVNHQFPEQAEIDTVIMHLPKSLNFFAWQLEQIQQCLTNTGSVLLLGMVKHISKGHIELMTRYFSNINPGRAEKKARVIQLTDPIPHSESKASHYAIESLNTDFTQLPGCFAENNADPGALVFIDYLKTRANFNAALDLGCGNGVLSVALTQASQTAAITLIDESQQALNSAKANLCHAKTTNRLRFIHSDGTNALGSDELFDLIVCNPPFHQGFSLTEKIAHKLFSDAHKHLTSQGEFWVVANRHLPYYSDLKKRFGRVALKSKHPKFNVYFCQL